MRTLDPLVAPACIEQLAGLVGRLERPQRGASSLDGFALLVARAERILRERSAFDPIDAEEALEAASRELARATKAEPGLREAERARWGELSIRFLASLEALDIWIAAAEPPSSPAPVIIRSSEALAGLRCEGGR